MNVADIKTDAALRAEAFRRYQFEWAKAHGYAVRDVFEEALKYARDAELETARMTDAEIQAAFEEWEADCAFGGECWSCPDEFLSSEYRDPWYMKYLLPEPELFAMWQADPASGRKKAGDGA